MSLSPWRLELLGGFSIRRQDETVSHFRTKKTAALLAYLACFRRPHPREVLIELLWPECDPARGRDSLRTALAALRRQLEPAGSPKGSVLRATPHDIALNTEAVRIDLADFEAALAQARQADQEPQRIEALSAAAQLYKGPLLAGYYEPWIPGEAERLEEQFCAAVLQLVRYWHRVGETGRALDCASRAVVLHPQREELHSALMRLHVANHQPALALRQFDELRRVLQQCDAEPGRQVRLLGEEIARAAAPPNNLPALRTRLIGREQDVQAVGALLRRDDVGLVTLTGAGGIGKTQLALQVAATLAASFGDGTFFVALAALQEPALVLGAIAQALKVRESTGVPLSQCVQDFLKHKRLLLVLDNFEHVAAAADDIAALLAACPKLTILITSRSRLGLWGEHVFPVPPLVVPDLKPGMPAAEMLQCSAIQLFCQRATRSRPDFVLTGDNVAAVARICTHLDGLPLAIELAASRMDILTPAEMLGRLHERFQMLRTQAPDLPVRHRTLQGVFAWSYGLLPHAHRDLLCRLAVFAGSFDLPAAEAVCRTENVFDGIAELCRHSLVRSEIADTNKPTRFALLESVREYALEQLAAERSRQGLGLEQMQERHAQYFLETAELRSACLRTDDEPRVLDELQMEVDNLRAAVDWSSQAGRGTLCARLALSLYHVLYHRGYWTEARQAVELGQRGLDATAQTTPAAAEPGPGLASVGTAVAATAAEHQRCRALLAHALACVCHDMGDFGKAQEAAEASLTLRRAVHDDSGTAEALNLLGLLAADQDQPDRAQTHYAEALRITPAQDHQGRAKILHNLARLAVQRDQLIEAEQLYEETLSLRRAAGDLRGEALTLGNMGALAMVLGNHASARRLYRSSLALNQALRDPHGVAVTLYNLAEIAELEGDMAHAVNLFGQARRMLHDLRSPHVAAPTAALERLCQRLGTAKFAAISGSTETGGPADHHDPE